MLRVSMVSLTYANKSKMLLERQGYKVNISHNVTNGGCEYVLTVDAPKGVVLDTLRQKGIPIKSLTGGA